MYTKTEIEDAIIAALAPLKTTLRVRTIKSHEEELVDEETIAAAVRLFPAVIAVYTGSDYINHGARKIEKPRFMLFFLDKSLRASGEARRGGANNPGIYAMLDGARDLLYGKTLSLNIFPLALIREEAVWYGKGIQVFSAEYESSQALLYPDD